jgi:uncharacterized membrane protein
MAGRTSVALMTVGLCAAIGTPDRAAATYEVIDLGVVPAINDGGWDVNDSGLVAGTAWFGASSRKAFAFKDGKGWFLGDDFLVHGLNNAGQIIANKRAGQCYLYTQGSWMDVPFSSGVYDINDRGLLFGTNYEASGWHAAIYEPSLGLMTDIGALPGHETSNAGGLNNAGQAVGWCASTAYLYEDGDLIDLGRGYAQEINDLGDVVGYSGTMELGFVYHDGSFSYLSPFGTPLAGPAVCQPYDVNDLGVAVGAATYDGSPNSWVRYAFIYSQGVMTNLNELIPSDSGWELRYAYGINNRNWIVGYGRNPQGLERAFLLIPEPATLSLLALCGLAAMRRRWRRRL